MKLSFAFLLLLAFPLTASSNCVDINTPEATSLLNATYHQACYQHTISKLQCCDYLLLDKNCRNIYQECVAYEDYILNNLYHQCHNHNQTINNINYSDSCHNFTLHIEPYCCDNISIPECTDLYIDCNHFGNHTVNLTDCDIPSKYTNDYCSDYTKHVDEHCCEDFTDTCVQIYSWCLDNNPQHVSVLDLFIGPYKGHTIGTNVFIYKNIPSAEDCADLCVTNSQCNSFDYITNLNECYLSKHMLGDDVNGEQVHLIIDQDLDSQYYEKKFQMPYEHTNCNVKYVTWLGDSICDDTGGYNTADCFYDDGDCCQETCKGGLCGLFGYNCQDPAIINPPTNQPTSEPTTSQPTSEPTTITPTSTPITSEPTSEPTTLTPTSEPTSIAPTDSPSTLSPTKEPTSDPTNQPSTGAPTGNPTTASPTGEPTIVRIVYKSTSSDSDNNTGVVNGLIATVVILIVTIATLFFIGYRSFKSTASAPVTSYSQNTQVTTRNRSQNVVTNPVYNTAESGDEVSPDSYTSDIRRNSGTFEDIYDEPVVDKEDDVENSAVGDEAYDYKYDDEDEIDESTYNEYDNAENN